jgi:hypothetical protein
MNIGNLGSNLKDDYDYAKEVIAGRLKENV